MHIKPAILLIGSGRMANHLKHWNSLLDQPNRLLFWNRSQDTETLNKNLNQCDLIWLAISDSAIIPFFEEYLKNSKKAAVHFSGALSDERLLCTHPLMSFPQSLLPNDVYAKIHFVVNGVEKLQEALPGFTNAFSALSSDKKSLYHALCVLAGNFPQLLWNEATREMKNLNLPQEALDLYIDQITKNYLLTKEKSLTGPLVRKDYVTIEKNISALHDAEKLKNIYITFTKEFSR